MNVLPKSNPEISHVVAFPYNQNLELGPDGEPAARLSVLSNMAVDGAVALWEENPDSQLIFPGATCFPEDLPDTADLMIERARDAGVPEEACVGLHRLPNGRLLNDTHLQAEAVRLHFEDEPLAEGAQAVTLALAYHLKRARQACEVRDIPTDFAAVEDVLEEVGGLDEYKRYLPLFDDLKWSERALNALDVVDPRGRLLDRWVEHAGARIVDFVETEGPDGRARLMTLKTSAAKRYETVTGQPA